MRLLLDTHALLWWWTDDPRLSRPAREAIADEAHEVLVSAASAWELATKARLGKLESLPEAVTRFEALVAADGFTPMPVTQRHALRSASYALPHRDPFDRMLAAQAELEGLTLVTVDAALSGFPGARLW